MWSAPKPDSAGHLRMALAAVPRPLSDKQGVVGSPGAAIIPVVPTL
jgi:hypothetical protein